MQSKKNNRLVKKTVQKISNRFRNKFIYALTILIFVIFIAALLFILIFNRLIFSTVFKSGMTGNKQLFSMAEEAYEKGYLENSALLYRNYVNSNPDDKDKIKSFKRIFEISVLSSQFDEAFIALKEIELIDSKYYEVYLDRIQLMMRLGEYDSAYKEIERHENILKSSPRFQRLKAQYFMHKNNHEKALGILQKLPNRKRDYQTHLLMILNYIELGDFKEAIEYTSFVYKKFKTLEQRNKISAVMHLSAVSSILAGDRDGAYDAITTSLELSPDNDANMETALFCYVHYDDRDKVIEIYDRFVSEEIKSPALTKLMGDYFIFKEDYDKALVCYEKIKEDGHLDNEGTLTLADLYFFRGQYEKSIDMIHMAGGGDNKGVASFYKNLSILYNRLDNFNDAMFYLKEGRRIFADTGDFDLRMAVLYYEHNFLDSALDRLEKAELYYSSKGVSSSKVDNLRSVILEKQKKFSETILLEQREKDSNNPDNYFRLIRYYLQNNNLHDVRREISTVKKLALSDDQRYYLSNYEMILYSKLRDYDSLYILEGKIFEDDEFLINTVIFLLLQKDFKNAREILVKAFEKNRYYSDTELLGRLHFLNGLTFYYEGNFKEAYRSLNNAEELSEHNENVFFLKNLIKGFM